MGNLRFRNAQHNTAAPRAGSKNRSGVMLDFSHTL